MTIPFFENVSQKRLELVSETAVAQHAIANSGALDKFLRYETAIERNRIRAIEQLPPTATQDGRTGSSDRQNAFELNIGFWKTKPKSPLFSAQKKRGS